MEKSMKAFIDWPDVPKRKEVPIKDFDQEQTIKEEDLI